MTSVARYCPTPLPLFVERVISDSSMILVPIFSVNCRRQTYFPILSNGCYVQPPPLCRWPSGVSFSDSPHRIYSRRWFSLKTGHFLILMGWGGWAWSLVAGTIIFVFLIPSLNSVLIFVENRAFFIWRHHPTPSGQTDRNSKWPPALTITRSG